MLIKLQEPQKLHHRIIQKQIKKKYLREWFILLELRHKIIDDLRLKKIIGDLRLIY